MFCENCGKKLPDLANFCVNCGTSVNKENQTTITNNDTEIQFIVKPTFKIGYMILPYFIVYTLMIAMISLIFISFGVMASLVIFVLGFIMLVIILGMKSAIIKKQYDGYCYEFYKTKVIYKDNFLNLIEKEVKYKYIREVTMHQTYFQKYFNLGNIILFTNAESGSSSGIYIKNVENVQEVYDKVKFITKI